MHIDTPALLQFLKYVVAGVIATGTHILIFHLIAWKVFPALQAKDPAVRFFKMSIRSVNDTTRARNSIIGNCIAFIISNGVAYVLNVLWVFQGGKYHYVIEILFFYAISGSTVLLGTILMSILIKRFGLLTTYAFSVNIFTAVLLNYFVRKIFIFSG